MKLIEWPRGCNWFLIEKLSYSLVGIGWWVWSWCYEKINPFELENSFFWNWSCVIWVVEFAGLSELVFIYTTLSALFQVNLFLFFFFWLLTCIKIIVLIILLCIIAPRLFGHPYNFFSSILAFLGWGSIVIVDPGWERLHPSIMHFFTFQLVS